MAFQWNDDLIRKLIEIVKVNVHLYNKSSKLFKDTKVKSLTWDTIANNIATECTGEEACRKFKSLRDNFRKEYKKVKDCAGRSGDAGDSTQYESSWEFYHELLFLAEHITERRSVSNIVRKNISVIIPKEPLFTHCQTESEGPVTLIPVNSTSEIKSLTTETMDSVFSQQELTSCQENSELNLQLQEVILSPAITDNEFETSASISDVTTQSETCSSDSALSIRQKAFNSLKVPKPDLGMTNKKRKYNSDKEIQKSLDKLTQTAMKAFEQINTPSSANTSSLTSMQSSMDPYAQIIASALQEISKDKKFRCVSVIMQVLDMYSKGKEAKIVEKNS